MTRFWTITGHDFARSIAWARRQPDNPINAAIRRKLMSHSNHQIQAAINAAESVTPVLATRETPVTITQETIVVLIAAAKEYLELRD